MTQGKVDFTGVKWGSVEWTNLCTLYMRAYESRTKRPILGDTAAAEAVDRIDYDFDRIRKAVRPSSSQFLVSLRAKRFDEWASDFLDRHPDAVVLHLGCGLDSRAFRLRRPSGVRWFDVDVPAVINLRRRIYPEQDGYRMIGSSVTDPGWLDEVPTDSPVLVVAEGLLMYLEESEVRTLLLRLTDRFGSGELLFDGMPPWVVLGRKIFRWATRGGRELGQWDPRLKLLARTSPLAEYARIPSPGYRLLYRLMNAVPGLNRVNPYFRFAF